MAIFLVRARLIFALQWVHDISLVLFKVSDFGINFRDFGVRRCVLYPFEKPYRKQNHSGRDKSLSFYVKGPLCSMRGKPEIVCQTTLTELLISKC